MVLYKTIKREAVCEQIIEKSRFIAHIAPVESREEAENFINAIKKEHKSATHNVPVMVIGDKMQLQWASDDGEPQGTSGFPILSMLVNENITNVAIVVTRYFGGIKLGTGGLVRAYTSSAKKALESAGTAEATEVVKATVEADYTYLSAIQKQESTGAFKIGNIEYGEKIVLECLTEKENLANMIERIAEATYGRGKILSESFEIVKI